MEGSPDSPRCGISSAPRAPSCTKAKLKAGAGLLLATSLIPCWSHACVAAVWQGMIVCRLHMCIR